MSETPHLALPLLAAAQAQKHVTHNEALASLDALVHLAVKERGRTVAPETPDEGDRYLVGSGASGDFAGHEGEIALFDLGVWRFFAPRSGWRAYVEAEDRIVVFDGSQWRDLGRYARDLDRIEHLGIGTEADDLNRFSAKLNAALFAALTAEEGGTGDLRFILNKGEAVNVLSQLYQRGFSGRAETGLIGSDDFSIRVSPDGTQWRDALLADRNTGVVSFPSGLANLPGANLLLNPAFRLNQRLFAGGNLSGGAYGYDRWKGGTGGCVVSRAGDGTVTLTGPLDQVVDLAHAPLPGDMTNFAGATLTLSVQDPSGPLPVVIGTQAATIPAGAGRRSATITLGQTETGNVTVRLQPASPCSFKRVKLEIGPVATPWIGDPLDIEEFRCRRYYQKLATSGSSPMILGALGQRVASNIIDIPYALPVQMRAAPNLATSGFAWANGSPVGNQVGFYDIGSAAWVTLSGGLTVTTAVATSPTAIVLRLQAGSSFTGTAGAVGNFYIGGGAAIVVHAEL